MNTPHFTRSCLLLALMVMFSISRANNGTIAYAYPMNSITVDGDLSDWPKDMTSYPIEAFLFGQGLSGENDLQARFRIGYNLDRQMLYIAVETTDDAYLGDKTADAEWNTHDIHNLYIDLSHDPRGSGAISHLVSQDYRRIAERRPHEYWDPQVQQASWDPIRVSITRNGNQTIYEWSCFMGDKMEAGRSIGFDYEVIDKDPEEEGFPSVLAWSPGVGKGFNTGNVGDIILMKAKNTLGTLSGKIKWKQESELSLPNRLLISSLDKPECWVVAQVDSAGMYSLTLPKGNYELSPLYPMVYAQEVSYRINMDTRVQAQIHQEKSNQASPLVLEILPKPDLIPQKGILAQFEAADKVQIDRFMQVFMDYYYVPGASLALVKDGKVVYHQTYGYKNAYTKDKVDAHTLFEAASITKPVFAFAVNRLVERGEFDLDKPLHEYLPFDELADDERYKSMTGRHVLVHTSGLPNWGRTLQETPGTKYGYSGEGFEYLKRAVAHATQRDIEELVAEEVLNPLGITHTYFSKNDALMKVMAHGHFDYRPTLFDVPTEPGMAHSMYTEAHTFTNFMIALLERKGLKADTYAEMFRPQTKVPTYPMIEKLGWKEHFGLGILVTETPMGMSYGHGGNNGDFRCQFEVYDAGKLGFALFTNGSNGNQLVNALRELLITGKE